MTITKHAAAELAELAALGNTRPAVDSKIDSVLRERARVAAYERMQKAMQPLRDLIAYHGGPLPGLAYSPGCESNHFDPIPNCATVLAEIEELMLPRMVDREHRRIVSEFIARVDRIEKIESAIERITHEE